MTISFHAERPVFDLCKQPSYLSSVFFVKQKLDCSLFPSIWFFFSKTCQIHKLKNVLKYLDMSTRIFIRVPAVNDAERLDGVLVHPL